MPSTNLSDLLSPALLLSSGTLGSQSVYSSAPALSLITTTALLDPAFSQLRSQGSSSSVGDAFRQIQGTLTFTSGQATSSLTTPSGTSQQTYNLSTLATEYSNFSKQVQGVVSFSNGNLTSDLTTPSGPLQGTVNLSGLGSLNQLSGNLSFNNGTLTSNLTGPSNSLTGTIDLSALITNSFSYLEQVNGTVTLRNGVLSSNLTAPNGQSIVGSLDLTALATTVVNGSTLPRPVPLPSA
jgi:hypothetical protein